MDDATSLGWRRMGEGPMGIRPGGTQPLVRKRVVRHPDRRGLVNGRESWVYGVLATR